MSALQLPLFSLRPPRGYGVLTTAGRRTGKKRSRCLRAVRHDNTVYLLAIKGAATAWVKNALAASEVQLRLPSGTFTGKARQLEAEERELAVSAYCGSIYPFDYAAYVNWRSGRPTPGRVRQLLEEWVEGGALIAVDVQPG